MGALSRMTSLLLLASGCPGSMAPKDQSGPVDRGEGGRRADQQKKVDATPTFDLPVTPGVPCLSGACGANLICMANECLKMCTQPDGECNAKVATCGAQEACMFASSFTDACYPAKKTAGQACDYSQAIYCAQGALCVTVGTASPICLQLCQYGCPANTTCRQTNPPNVCNVCVPN